MKRNFDAKELGREFDLALRSVTRAMLSLELVLERYEGDEDIISNGYPFAQEFGEQVSAVQAWCSVVAETVGQ